MPANSVGGLWADTSWGSRVRPDVLLNGHHDTQTILDAAIMQAQEMRPPHSVPSPKHCHQDCVGMLGCVAWTWQPDRRRGLETSSSGRCSLRQWLPQGWWHERGSFAGILHEAERCKVNCSLAFPVQQLFGPNPRMLLRSGDVEQLPWLQVNQGVPPEPPRLPLPTEPPPRIAVCLAGQVRTLVHPSVSHSLWTRVLDRGRHDLFAVLGTGTRKQSHLSQSAMVHANAWPDRAPHACELEVVLEGLRPVAVAFELIEERISPCHTTDKRQADLAYASLQFRKWARCISLVKQHEQRASLLYDFVFKTRPDIYWRENLRLAHLAASMPSPDVVLTCNDLHVLVHRSHWDMLKSIKSIACDRRCAGASPLLRGFFDNYNEYCLMMAHFARHRIRHLEVSHPLERSLMHFVSSSNWTAGLRLFARRPRIARARFDPNTDTDADARTVCIAMDGPDSDPAGTRARSWMSRSIFGRRLGTAGGRQHRISCAQVMCKANRCTCPRETQDPHTGFCGARDPPSFGATHTLWFPRRGPAVSNTRREHLLAPSHLLHLAPNERAAALVEFGGIDQEFHAYVTPKPLAACKYSPQRSAHFAVLSASLREGGLPPRYRSGTNAPSANWMPGFCAETSTSADHLKACETQQQGSLPLGGKHGIVTRAQCVDFCYSRCRRCRYVSYSRELNDCSWFSSCPTLRTHLRGSKEKLPFMTRAVG